MIEIRRFTVNPLAENCYVVSHRGEAAIVDCGAMSGEEWGAIERYVEGQGLRPVRALQTHMHFDHVFGLDFLFERYGLRPECHASEEAVYEMNPRIVRQLCGMQLPCPTVAIGTFLADGQRISVGGKVLEVIHTPGHTQGCVCFYCEDDGQLLSGDTLFRRSIGRTDHPYGDTPQEIDSIRRRLLCLPSETIVWPGHGPATTIGEELTGNPYL